MELSIGSSFSYFLGGRKSALYLFGLLQAALLFYFVYYYSDYIWYIPVALLGAAILWASWRSQVVWIISAILAHLPLFLQASGEVTVLEEIVGAYIYGTLAVWFFERIFMRRVKLTISAFDRFLIFFLVLSLCSIILAVVYESELGRWFREYAVFLGYLYYFPIRELVRQNKKNVWSIVTALCLAALLIGALNLLNYRRLALQALQLWELWGSRRVLSTTLFMAAFLGGSGLFFYARKRFTQLVAAGVTAFFAVALLITFARGFWLSALFGLGLMFFFLDLRRKMKFAITGAIATGLVLLVLYLTLGPMTQPVLKSFAGRLVTLSRSSTDRSLRNRMIESETVLTHIKDTPIVGHGLGASYTTFNLFSNHSEQTWYVHNGFLFLWFKLGIIGLLLFLLMYFSMIVHSYHVFREETNLPLKGLALGILSILAAMLLVSYTSGQFYERGPVLIYALCWGIISGLRFSANKSTGELRPTV